MAANLKLEHPMNLLDGEKFLFCMGQPGHCEAIQEIVRFVGFTPCPATVIVLDHQNRRMIIDRCRLYRLPEEAGFALTGM